MYEIENGLPIPPRHTAVGGTGHKKYPFREMQVGDSFVVDKPQPSASALSVEAAKRIGGSVKFTCRKVDAITSRIWRIA